MANVSRKQIVELDSLELREKSGGLLDDIWKPNQCKWRDEVRSVFPIVEWLADYQWRTSLLKDIIAGITVGIFQIPQGMAYGMLGNVEPIIGLYMAFFPPLLYVIFGTSRHNSVGTFAVVCLMSGSTILKYSNDDIETSNDNNTSSTTTDSPKEPEEVITKLQVAIALSFTVSLIHLGMYILRLGIISRLLSETVVSSFLTACAIYVLLSQFTDMLGLPIKTRRGLFRNIYLVYDVSKALPRANVPTVIISLIALIILILNQYLLKPYLSKKCRFPFPIELITLIMATLFSYLFDFHERFNVRIVGSVPSGLPVPIVPRMCLMKNVILDAISIAIVSYAITVSMGRLFAQKLMYDINANQELLALGLCNLLGSFFSCMPISAALARTSVQFVAGGVTQLTTLVNCIIILFVLLWIGPLFYCLPKCILATVIVVALKGMLLEARNLVKFWHLSKLEAAIWLITFVVVVCTSIVIGLSTGVALSLISISFQSCRPNNCLLGVLVNTETYLDVNRYKQVAEIDGIKIFHFVGCLNFITKSMFKSELIEKINFNPRKFIQERERNELKGIVIEDKPLVFKHLILDLSGLTYIDPMGVDHLAAINQEFKIVNINVYLVCTSGRVHDTIVRWDLYTNKSKTFITFPTVHDAVIYAQQNKTK